MQRGLLLSLLAFLATACSHAVVVEAPRPDPMPIAHDGGTVVWVAPAVDGRRDDPAAGGDPRHLGWRHDNVGTGQRPVRLDRPVAEWATERLVAVLARHGLAAQILSPTTPAPAVWLQPTVDRLELSAGTEDRFATTLSLALRHRGKETPAWRQTVRREETKFTGVGGTAMAHLVLLVEEEIDAGWEELLVALGSGPGAAATQPTGTLQIDTVPPGARVYVDGAYYGTTPFHLEIAAGVHELRLEHPGYAPAAQRVGVVAGRATVLSTKLSPTPTPAQGDPRVAP